MFRWFLAFLFILQSCCLAIELKPAVLRQGECLFINLPTQEGILKAEGEFVGQRFRFYGSRGVIGVPVSTRPGKYPLFITLNNEQSKLKKVKQVVKIVSARFPVVHFRLKPAKKKLLASKKLIREEWGQIERVLIAESREQLWEGRFVKPVRAPISMYFGTREFINRKKGGRHTGLDLAAPKGTTVEAANNGIVVFAKPLKVFGGTIVIDHGQGVHSLYFHLSKLLAGVGQRAAKGETIAQSGNSGVSSGPHLHWGISVHNLRVNPVQWTIIY